MERFAAVLFVLIGLVTAGAPQAQNWAPLLKGSPFSAFNEEDMSLFVAARDEALEKREDGSTVSWSNPDTDSSGSVTPIETRRGGGDLCRLLQFVNRVDGRTGESRFWFCRQPDGTWKIATPESS